LHYKWRKLHSLLGIVPVGLFLLEHLTVNSLAAGPGGARAFDAAVRFLRGLPYLLAIELLFIFFPMVFHGIYGLIITAGAGWNTASYNLWRNWMYLIQRISGVITFIFVTAHLWTLRIASLINPEVHVNFALMRAQLLTPWIMAFYIIGVLAAIFHLANGLWNFCITWGITVGPKSQRACAWICAALGCGLGFMGVNALLAFVGKAVTLPG
jgi:succinate dehydrogenase / fumarate reductase, cytochrome b subunit